MVTEQDLAMFYGTEGYVRHISGVNLTDGVVFLRENGECFWLIDDICFAYKDLQNCPFQIWQLKKTGDTQGVLTMREDTNEPVKYNNEYNYTDIWQHVAMDKVKMHLINGVLLLPSEY